ncbi:MAG: chloride channel protein [Planctomycetota bacterium]
MPPEAPNEATPPPAPDWVRRLWDRLHLPSDWYVIALGAVVGGLTAFGAVGFATALEWLEHHTGDLRTHWPLWTLPLIPMAGALITGLLVHFGARDARGHGVPQVIDALSRKKGVIPAKVGIVKILASIATVGTGGSAGAEGPIVQIGSTAGSVFGRIVRVGREHQGTLVGCGAAAGIASVFNAPIAGVFFVLEILLRDFSLRTFTPVVFASVFSASVTQVLLGEDQAIFAVELPEYAFTVAELPLYALLGLVCAAVGVGFTWLLHAGEDSAEKIAVHPIIKPTLGALGLGLLGIAFLLVTSSDPGTPGFFGNGYETIRGLLEPEDYTSLSVVLVFALLGCKALGTVLTLATGGSGGVFAPSLFLGATAGAALGMTLDAVGLLPEAASPASYALVGMAAVVSGTTFAPLTAILLIFELTREPRVLLPVMLGAIVATIVARVWMRDSIYTMRLRQAGVLLSAGRDLTVMRRVPAAGCELGPLPPEPVHASDPLSKLITLHANHNVPDFIVTDPENGAYMGIVAGSDIRTALIDREAIPLLLVAELLRTDLPTVSRDETLDTVLDKFAEHDVASLCVVSPIDRRLPIGVITRREVLKRYRRALEEG